MAPTNISLRVENSSKNGSYHVAVYLNGKNSGILYLNEEQKNILNKVLKTGVSIINDENLQYEFDGNDFCDIEDIDEEDVKE